MPRLFQRSPVARSFRVGLILLLVRLASLSTDAAANPIQEPASGRHRHAATQIREPDRHDKKTALAEQNLAEAGRLRAEGKIQSYQQAIKKYEEAKSYFQAIGDRAREAAAFMNVGQIYEALNDSDNALINYNQALGLSQQIGDRRAQSDILNCIGYLYYGFGNNQRALSNANSALSLSQQTKNRRGEAGAFFTIGEAYYGFGDLKKAIAYYDQALQLWRQLNDSKGQAQVLIEIGYAYSYTDEIVNARKALLEGLELSMVAHDIRLQAVSLRALGSFETNLGDSQRALDYFQQALEKLKVVDDRLIEATVLGGMGYTYEKLGNNERALELDRQAVTIFQAIGNTWGEAELQMDLGRVCYLVGNSEESLSHHQRALSLFRLLGMVRYQAQTLRDMGALYDSWNQKDKALAFYQDSLALTRRGQDQRYEAYTLNYLGSLYASLGDSGKALGYYQKALALSHAAADPSGEALAFYNLARLERDRDELKAARGHSESALQLVESIRGNVLNQDSRATYFGTVRQQYELYIDILMSLNRQEPRGDFASLAFAVSERARARSFLETLRETRADIRGDVDPALLDRERLLNRLLDTKAQRRTQLLADKNDAEADALAKEIDQVTRQYQEVRDQIKATSPRYAALTQPQPLSLKEIQQQLLADDSLLLEYMLGDERSYVWAVTRTEVATFELPGRGQIEEAALRFHKLLTANQPLPSETFEQRLDRVREANARIPEEAASFSKMVLGPVMTKLGSKRLLIVPDGALQYIPFQALVVSATAQNNDAVAQSNTSVGIAELVPLMVDHEIVNEPSASALALVLKESAQRKESANTVAVFANPVFEADDPRIKSRSSADTQAARPSQETQARAVSRDAGFGDGLRIPSLPASAEEAKAIMAVVPWRTGFKAEGFEASRATIMRPELGQYRIVHFATHGVVNYQHPELSGLVLSLLDERGKPLDGYLRMHDIYNLKLPVDLVVLSACNTALGKDVKGEGLIGLTRGFMYAGAGGVVASLWKVDDDATAELMTHFYEGMFKRGLTPAAALREAQLAMWRQKRWHASYYWAAFVIQGQYNQQVNSGTKQPTQLVVILVILVSGLSLGGFFLWRRRRTRVL